MKYFVIIIHTSEDTIVASLVRDALEEGEMSCGQIDDLRNSDEETAKMIDTSEVVVLILSHASNNSAQVRWAMERAANARKEIIPFRIDNARLSKHLEFYLSLAHWLDASTPPLEHHIIRLVATARHLLGLGKERAAKKAITAMVFGILSIPIGGSLVFGPLAIILGKMELRSIASGRSFRVGRKYARIGIVFGGLGIAEWIVLAWLYWNDLPYKHLVEWFTRG